MTLKKVHKKSTQLIKPMIIDVLQRIDGRSKSKLPTIVDQNESLPGERTSLWNAGAQAGPSLCLLSAFGVV
jgi:hypothetical protein